MNRELIDHLHRVGQAQYMVKELLSRDIFHQIDKHSPFWESEYDLESDKLEDVRQKLCSIEYQLEAIQEALKLNEGKS